MSILSAISNDTICAISTPPGTGGIAVVRVSGKDAIETAGKIWHGANLKKAGSHTAHLGTIDDSHGNPLDQAVATVFIGPHSFTGEDTVEISVHGSPFIQRELLASLVKAGARIAEPGEFTRRAFTSGNLDLAQAEAVADMIASSSRAAHRIAFSQMKGGFSRRIEQLRQTLIDIASLLELELDFSEEDVEFADRSQLIAIATRLHDEVGKMQRSFASGNAIKEGIPVAIAGATNAGKSSLLNALLEDDRAIVSDIHGTTRDTIEETAEIGDYRFRFIDTAGLRDTADTIEKIGIERSRRAIGKARIVVLVIDGTLPPDPDILNSILPLPDGCRLIAALNKTDMGLNQATSKWAKEASADGSFTTVELSAATGDGIDTLRRALEEMAHSESQQSPDELIVTNARHAQALGEAAEAARRIISGLNDGLSGDLVAQDVRETIRHLSAITGQIPSSEILSTIFSRFCIGK